MTSPAPTPEAAHGKFPVRQAMILFAICLLARLPVLVGLVDSPLFLPEKSDMSFYNNWGLRILGGEWTDGKAFYGLPGYAYWLAFWYAIAGYNPFVPALIQVLCDAGIAVLILRIAHAVLPGRPAQFVGWIGGLAWVGFQPAAAYSVVLMPTSLIAFVYWWLILRLILKESPLRWDNWLAFGWVVGTCAMMIATLFLSLPIALLRGWQLLRASGKSIPRSLGHGLAGAAILLGGVYLGTAPAWMHNRFVAREPVFLSAHSGVNFYIGNHALANGYPKIPSGLPSDQAGLLANSITVAEKDLGRSLTRAEVSQFWSEKAGAVIAEDRGRWHRLLLTKFSNAWNAFSYDDLSLAGTLSDLRILLPGWGFGVLAFLGLPACLLCGLATPKARIVFAGVIFHLLALLPVFVTERYRMAAAPGLALFAAWTLYLLWKHARTREWKALALWLLLLALSAVFVFQPRPDPMLRSLQDYNTGIALHARGELDWAERRLERARELSPDSADIAFALGNLRLSQKRVPEAQVLFEETIERRPLYASAWNNLGVLHFQAGQNDKASAAILQAEKLEPGDARRLFLLASIQKKLGNTEMATRILRHAVDLDPAQPVYRETMRQWNSEP